MARNRHVSFARPDSANVPFSFVYHEGSDGGPHEEQQQQQQQQEQQQHQQHQQHQHQHQHQQPPPQDGGPWTLSLQSSSSSSSSVPRGYAAEIYVPSQHQQHPAYPQLEHSSSNSSVGRHLDPSAGWPPPSGSTASHSASASAHGDDSAERVVADPAFRIPHPPAGPAPPQGRSQQPPRPLAGAYGQFPAVQSTAASRGPPMQLMHHSNLAVLNAEQYDDGRGRGSAAAGPAASRKPPQPTVIEEPAPKKRGRGDEQPAVHRGGPEEDKKRTRGRPRLESTSETPQERRRTQIRLAQRAYRDRKEGAISTLEKEVEDLKAENQKVTQAYQELLARVQRGGGGSLDDDPGVLVKRLSRDDSDSPPSDDTQQQQPAKRVRHSASEDSPLPSSSTAMTTMEPMQHPDLAVAQQPMPLWAGVIVTHEPLMTPPTSSYPPATPYAGPAFVGPEFFGGGVAGPGGYEVLAQATPQNASFAPALSFAPVWPPDGPASSSPWAFVGGNGNGGEPPAPAASSSPFSLLPAPTSFAYQEATFGRRLHRTLLQRAARLATMAHPPPAALARVFGFAMLFESLDQIRARTLALLAPAERASLFEDRYPFQNLGGAGSHYPAPRPSPCGGDSSSEGQPSLSVALQPSSSPSSTPPPTSDPAAAAASPVDRDPYAMGPMDPRVAKIRDTLVSLGGQIALPGFDGIFWDPEEVEFYLRHNGVVIPPAADHHIVEIPDGAFGPPPSSSSPSTTTTTTTSDAGSSSASGGSATTTTTSFHDHHGAFTALPQHKAPPLTGAGWSLDADFLGAHYTTTTTTAAAAHPSDLTYAYSGHGGSGGGGASDSNHIGYGARPRRRVWRMNVELFVKNLTAKTTCLGRSPGIRPSDVDAAFWASVSDPASAL